MTVDVFATGSMRFSGPATQLGTHTAPAPAEIATQLRPKLSMFVVAPVEGSIRVVRPTSNMPAQTAPDSTAMPSGCPSTGIAVITGEGGPANGVLWPPSDARPNDPAPSVRT